MLIIMFLIKESSRVLIVYDMSEWFKFDVKIAWRNQFISRCSSQNYKHADICVVFKCEQQKKNLLGRIHHKKPDSLWFPLFVDSIKTFTENWDSFLHLFEKKIVKPHKISTHLLSFFLSIVWLSWNFVRFHQKKKSNRR